MEKAMLGSLGDSLRDRFRNECVYARNIDSASLDQLVRDGIKQNRPVFIIVNPSKSVNLPNLDDDSDEGFEDVKEDKTLRNTWNRDRRDGIHLTDTFVQDCKQVLREMLQGKCSDEANCSEVVWKVANKICNAANKETIKGPK